jgi:hypothetical protein
MWNWFLLAAAALVVVTAYLRGEQFYLVWPYVPNGDSIPRTSKMEAAVRAAEGLAFTLVGVHRAGKGGQHKIRYEFWISPRRDVLLLIGGGHIRFLPVDECRLFSKLPDGRCLTTLDDVKADRDLSGLRVDRAHAGATLNALLDFHGDHLRRMGVSPVDYSETDPLEDHRAALSEQLNRMVEYGYARRVGKHWRYSLVGSVMITVRGMRAHDVTS